MHVFRGRRISGRGATNNSPQEPAWPIDSHKTDISLAKFSLGLHRHNSDQFQSEGSLRFRRSATLGRDLFLNLGANTVPQSARPGSSKRLKLKGRAVVLKGHRNRPIV